MSVGPAERESVIDTTSPEGPRRHTGTLPGPSRTASVRRSLNRITCPHCWHRFRPAQMLWVARHAELLGDQVLGTEKPIRFLPTRFTVEGQAIDGRGMACQDLACPECHLGVPRDLLEIEPLFLSIIGGPSSGKSYFLAAMTWELRQIMPARFAITFSDADTVANRSLNGYEETLFLRDDPDALVGIEKTQLQGELYDQISLGQQQMALPRPFLFTVRPSARHPNAGIAQSINRVICLYDNAGEHFLPGMDETRAPVTQHLAKSRVLMFLYDPTQDRRFRERCKPFSTDPQLSGASKLQRQETILTEAALRVRRYASLSSTEKLDRPLLVLVSKSDVWAPLLADLDLTTEPLVETPGKIAALDVPRVEAVSARLRELMASVAPEFVAAAEDFCSHVLYIPVSALGSAPEHDAASNGLLVRPAKIKPRWVTVPILYAFAKWSSGLIPTSRRRNA